MPAGNTYEPIATQTLGSSTGIVTFSSIPQTYTDLVFIVSAKASSATYDISALRVNSVTTNYSRTYLSGDGSSAVSGRGTAEISLRGGYLPGTNYTSQFTTDIYHFMNYSNTTTNKTVLCRCNSIDTAGQGFNVWTQVSLIPTTSAITQITLQTANGANLLTGSTFSLYGIKAA
jgi:hypothetical protein